MKKSEIFFNAILVPLDFCLIVFSVFFAQYLRFNNDFFLQLFSNPSIIEMDTDEYLKSSLFISPFIILVFALQGLYSMRVTRSFFKEVYHIFSASSSALAIIIIFLFFNRELFASRFVIILAWTLLIVFVSSSRIIIKFIQGYLAKTRGIGMHRVLIIGKNDISKTLKNKFEANPKLGYRFIGIKEDFDWEDLQSLKKGKGIDEIIQTDPELLKSKINMLIRFSDRYKIDYKYIPNLFQAHAINVNIKEICNFPLIELSKTPLDGWGKVIKRIFDIIFSLVFIICFFWLYLLIAVLIKLDSKGPIIYKDYRCGYKKKKFVFYKFRSLYSELCDGEFGTEEGNLMLKKLEKDKKKNTRKEGPLHKIKNDPRVTPFGKFIRHYSLDELPEFFNVLKGDMSVVGYRPHMVYEVQKYNYDQQRMFYIKPGITGLAQISGRSDLKFENEVRLDIYYMENWSLVFDLWIILKTPFVLFRRRKVA